MIKFLYEKVTGTPWTTTRSAAAEFGPPPAVEFATDLVWLTDSEVLLYGDQVVRQARARRVRAVEVAR